MTAADSPGVDVEVVDGDPSPLRERLIDLWIDVTEAGGAVGFRAPVTRAEVADAADALLREAAAGSTGLVAATRGTELLGVVAVVPGSPPRFRHRVTLGRLQVHPSLQGQGVGARLVEVAHRLARQRHDAELALVTVRDGLGLDRFYTRLGYQLCGRIADGLAFEGGERIDELYLVHRLQGPASVE